MYDWLWTHKNWINFNFDNKRLQKHVARFAFNLENNACPSIYFSKESHAENFKIMIQGFEAITSSEIEGETLNASSVIGSMRKRFEEVTLHEAKTDDSKKRRTGIVSAMVDAYISYDKPLTKDTLDHWNELLTETQRDQLKVTGDYRKHKEPMIVSGSNRIRDGQDEVDLNTIPENQEELIEWHKDHANQNNASYLAPPSEMVPEMMEQFIKWYNDTSPSGKNPLSPLVRAALTHLHFVMIHPYEDGNGRISRILAEKALSESFGKPTLISLSHRISQTKKEYYEHLENAARYGDIDGWMDYFCKTIVEAQQLTASKVQKAKLKMEVEDNHYPSLNERQIKIMDKLLNPSEDHFPEGINIKKYIALTKNLMPKGSKFTDIAQQDLDQLRDLGILDHNQQGKKERYKLKSTQNEKISPELKI